MFHKQVWNSQREHPRPGNSPGVLAGGVAVLLLALSAGACGSAGPGSEPATFDAIVHGHVTTPGGDPVGGVHLVGRAYMTSCADTAGAGFTGSGDVSTGSGTYEFYYETGVPQKITCLNVIAETDPYDQNQELEADTTVAVHLRTRPEPPFDSTRIDVVLRR